ncbi:MAG: LacI family DNA-binding transcriptional regulator [Anaerolineales bacterium]|nr:LacI family DNA-binding transcriptional regulator [Anaerolineales bacterium]
MKTTIEDVARLAGVSTGTVSNALTGKRPVAEETQKRIFAAMEELGYQPNLLARGLVNRRSHVISVVIKELSDLGFYGYSSAMTGIQREAKRLGYSLMLHFVDRSSDEEISTTLNQIQARRSDGIIWAIHEIAGNRDWVHDIQDKNYPPIIFLHMHPDPFLNVVSIDNRSGARMAVAHLIEQGCRKIGIITGPMDWWESQARLEGWRDSLEKAGMDPDPSLMVAGNWLTDSGQAGMEILLNRHPELEAVFAFNDSMALGAIHTACSYGLSIPEDLLLVGFDNMPEASSFWPPLTSVRQGMMKSGQLAVEELNRIIEANESEYRAPRQHILQPELFIRRSSMRGLGQKAAGSSVAQEQQNKSQ